MNLNNISPDWTGSTNQERCVWRALLKLEATPEAIRYFDSHCHMLSDYWYWFALSTLWVSYTGFSDLQLWKKLFRSERKNRKTSIMKPDELEIFKNMTGPFTVYRAHRKDETDWISYTLLLETAAKFAVKRKVDSITEYKLNKSDCIALFLRRGEYEILMLDPAKAEKVGEIKVVKK